MNDELRQAAEGGDINMLYSLIEVDWHLLEHIDKVQFVDTPSHIAANHGHTKFAAEIMRLKPSFARKLNQHGFSPIHIALQNQRYIMVHRFIQINKDLVRVKGREGLTPLHFVSQVGETYLLAKFLSTCPDSIEDATAQNETALHITVKNRQIAALEILVGWLRRIYRRGATYLEYSILNWKDEAGNTILHISALVNYPQSVRLLINSKINVNAKNFENSTALDIVDNQQTQVANAEIRDMLLGNGALPGNAVRSNSSLANRLRSKITVFEKILIVIGLLKRSITDDTSNTLLVVAVLIATATYQAVLSPPGAVYQADGANLKSTDHAGKPGNAGKAIMDNGTFLTFWLSNTAALGMSTLIIHFLLPTRKIISILMAGPVLCFFVLLFLIYEGHIAECWSRKC